MSSKFAVLMLSLWLVALAVAPAAAQQEVWLRWVDPAESAFSVEVPQGWRVEGGLRRMASVDVRPELLLTSPDGLIVVRLGDQSIAPMVQPDQSMLAMGLAEGRWYSPGYGVNLLVMRYQPGARFVLDQYLPQRLGKVRDVYVRDLWKASDQATRLMNGAGIQGRVDTADLTFKHDGGQGLREGYIFVQTRLIAPPGGQGPANWEVVKLAGYLADPRVASQAWRVYGRVMGSFQWNPHWWEHQMRVVGHTSMVISQTEDEVCRMMREVAAYRQEVADRAHDGWTEYIRSQRTIMGPDGPQQIDSGYDEYVQTPDGRIFGRNPNATPEGYVVGQDGAYYTRQ